MHQKHLRGEVSSTHDVVNLVAFEAELPHGAQYACAHPGANPMFPKIHGRTEWLESWESSSSLPFATTSTLFSPQEFSYSVIFDQGDVPSSDVIDQAVEVMIDEHERYHRWVFHTLDDH